MDTNKRAGASDSTNDAVKRRKNESIDAKQDSTFDKLPMELRWMVLDVAPECSWKMKLVNKSWKASVDDWAKNQKLPVIRFIRFKEKSHSFCVVEFKLDRKPEFGRLVAFLGVVLDSGVSAKRLNRSVRVKYGEYGKYGEYKERDDECIIIIIPPIAYMMLAAMLTIRTREHLVSSQTHKAEDRLAKVFFYQIVSVFIFYLLPLFVFLNMMIIDTSDWPPVLLAVIRPTIIMLLTLKSTVQSMIFLLKNPIYTKKALKKVLNIVLRRKAAGNDVSFVKISTAASN